MADFKPGISCGAEITLNHGDYHETRQEVIHLMQSSGPEVRLMGTRLLDWLAINYPDNNRLESEQPPLEATLLIEDRQ